jgi:hypothetical protein
LQECGVTLSPGLRASPKCVIPILRVFVGVTDFGQQVYYGVLHVCPKCVRYRRNSHFAPQKVIILSRLRSSSVILRAVAMSVALHPGGIVASYAAIVSRRSLAVNVLCQRSVAG